MPIELKDYIESLTAFTPADEDSIPVYDDSTDTMKRVLVSNIVPTADYSLYFDETYHQHVNHGYFWNRGAAAPGTFFYEAWVSPKTGAEYVISDGYGGAHNLLWGFNGFGTGKGTVSGNVAIAGAPVGFSSQDFIYEGDWHHIAVNWDGTNLRTYTDGVLSKVVSLSGVRQTLGNPSEGVMFVAGSDHSNYHGYIRMVRGFEGENPIGAALYYRPEINFKAAFNDSGSDDLIAASFLADYTRPGVIVPDWSSGYNGSVHPGYLASELDGSNTGTIDGGNPASGRINNLPEFRIDNPFVRPTIFRGTQSSIPVGAVGYDDFSRANVNLAWDDVLTLGTNRTGQVWTSSATASSAWGIVDGHAYCNNSGGVPSIAHFDLAKTNQDIILHRKDADTYAGPVGRYTDVNNYIVAEMFYSGAEYVNLVEVVAGVPTQLDSVATGGSANDIRLELVGTTAKVYINGSGTPIITETTAVTTGNRVGMRSEQILTRVKSIVAY
jgi:hypothetical protein